MHLLSQLGSAVGAFPRRPPGPARSQGEVRQHGGQGDLQQVRPTTDRVLRGTVVFALAVETHIPRYRPDSRCEAEFVYLVTVHMQASAGAAIH